jgi:ATP-binding cassette subfamily B (MDR/TAP) protein 1
VKQLNGVSLEGLASVIEIIFGLGFGITLGLIYDWKISLVSITLIPVQMAGAAITTKVYFSMSSD